MTVKIHLMLNSKILIDGNGDSIVATSLLEASNLAVLKVLVMCICLNYCRIIIHVCYFMTSFHILCDQESSVIHSNANLGVHGQGFLNLTGPGNLIEAQHLILSLFYGINVSLKFIVYNFACFPVFERIFRQLENKSSFFFAVLMLHGT